jgi:hypothetical protein
LHVLSPVGKHTDLVDRVRAALRDTIGPAAEQIAIDADERGVVTLGGVVEDETTRAVVIELASRALGAARVDDRLQVKPEWGVEAAPKQTEFGTRATAHGITQDDFDKLV